MTARHWWEDPFRGFQTNLREIDAGLDVERTLDAIEAYGADTWLLSVGGIIANHPSSLDCQSVNPRLAERPSGDLVGDAVEAAAQRGIRVLARMDFSKIDLRRAERWPQWCFVDADGAIQEYNGFVSMCPSGAYYQEKMFDVITEVVERYDVRGFFFNMMHFNERDYSRQYRGVCHCTACLEGFRAAAPGVEHPRDPSSPGYEAWRRWSTSVLDDLNRRMRDHLNAFDRDIALMLRGDAHVSYHEANNAVGRPLWHLATAESVSAEKSSDPGRAVYVNSVSFVDMPYRWAGEDPHHFSQYIVQAIAHGGSPSTYVMGTPETGRHACLEAGSRLTRYHRDNADLYAGLRSAARVALVRDDAGTGVHDPSQEEFRGCYRALSEMHVPFDVLRRSAISAVAPDRYDLLIAPDLGPWREDELPGLRRALEHGTAIALTGDSGWCDGRLQLMQDSEALRTAAHFASTFSLHVPVDASGDHVPVVGPFRVLDVAPEVRTGWHALGRSLYGPPEKCYGNTPQPHPGWASVTVGTGSLTVFPWRIGACYGQIGLERLRDAWIPLLLDVAGDAEDLAIPSTLPEQIQIVRARNRAGREVLHLLNRSGDAPQRFRPPLPVRAASIQIPALAAPRRVRARVAGEDLDWALEGARLTVRTPEIGLFEAVEIHWESAQYS